MAEMDLAKEDERPTQEPMRPRLEAPERRNLDTDDKKIQRRSITLPEPPSRNSKYTTPGYYVVDQTGNPISEPYTSPSLAFANLRGGAAVQYLDAPQGGHLNQPWPPELHTVVGHTAGREVVHDPEGHASNMGYAVYEDGQEIYRGPEWAAKLRLQPGTCQECGMSLDRGDHTHLGHTEQGDQMSYTEADLLRAMASTGDLNQQRYLMGALEEMRSDRHQVQAGAQQVDFAPPNHVGEYRPSHPHHQGPFGNSANTDWLTEMTQSNEGMAEHMLTMGSRFFVGCHPEVKSDPVEYMTQALGVARIAAGQFDDIEGAINMFMSHVANLNRVDITKVASEELLPWSAPPMVLPQLSTSEYTGPDSADQNTDKNTEPPHDQVPGLDNGESARQVLSGISLLSSHPHMSEFLFDSPTPEELAAASGPGNLNQQYGAPATSQDATSEPNDDGALSGAMKGNSPITASLQCRCQELRGDFVLRNGQHVSSYIDRTKCPQHKSSRARRRQAADHVHKWGPVEIARMTGNPHRKCQGEGCNFVSLDLHDDDVDDDDYGDDASHEASRRTASRAFTPEQTTYEEYMARLAPASAPVSRENFPGSMAARSPSANDPSVPEWGRRQGPKVDPFAQLQGYRGVTSRTAANEDMLNPQAFTNAVEDGSTPIRPQPSGTYDPETAHEQSGEAAHDITGLIPQTDLGETFDNISDFPETGQAEVPSTRAPNVGGRQGASSYRGDPHWMTARYPGKCSAEGCSDPINKGDQIFYYPNSKKAYVGSHAEANSRDFESGRADEDFYNHEGARRTAIKWSPASGMAGGGSSRERDAQGNLTGRIVSDFTANGGYGDFTPTHTYNPIGWDAFDSRPHPGSSPITPGSPVQLHGKMDPSGNLVHVRDENENHQTIDKRSLGTLRREGAKKDDDDQRPGFETGGTGENTPGAFEPDRSQYAESPQGQADDTEGYENAYSSGRQIDWSGTGEDVLGTVPVQGYGQDADHPNGEMWPWEQNPIGSPPQGAANVAGTPTPGMMSESQTGSSWPQPNVTKSSKLDAFRANIAARVGGTRPFEAAGRGTSEDMAAARAEQHKTQYGRPIDPSRYARGGLYNEHWEDHVGRGLVGFPNSTIEKVEPSLDYLTHGPVGSEALGTVHVRDEDGRLLKIPQDIFRIHSYEKPSSQTTASTQHGPDQTKLFAARGPSFPFVGANNR